MGVAGRGISLVECFSGWMLVVYRLVFFLLLPSLQQMDSRSFSPVEEELTSVYDLIIGSQYLSLNSFYVVLFQVKDSMKTLQ